MALECNTRDTKCASCHGTLKYFRMWSSYRDEDDIPDSMFLEEELEKQTPKTGLTWKRICASCELQKRQQEWESRSEEQRAKVGPDYATEVRVIRDMKRVNKGKIWNETASQLIEATRQIKQERDDASVSGSYQR